MVKAPVDAGAFGADQAIGGFAVKLVKRLSYWHISRSVQPTILQLSAPLAVMTHLRFGRRW